MSGWRAELRAQLGDFRLEVELGGAADRVLALVGPNGSGKTTLLRALVGAVATERAEIVVGERVLATGVVGLPIEQRRIGLVPQGDGLFPHLGVLDNVAFAHAVGPRRQGRAPRRAAAAALLQALGCAELADRPVAALSGGERQRVALARALFGEPELLLLDEPLAALDAITRRSVRRFLAEHLRRAGRPTVLVTHDALDVAALDAEVCVLERGRVVQRGDLAALRAAPANAFVAAFVDV